MTENMRKEMEEIKEKNKKMEGKQVKMKSRPSNQQEKTRPGTSTGLDKDIKAQTDDLNSKGSN